MPLPALTPNDDPVLKHGHADGKCGPHMFDRWSAACRAAVGCKEPRDPFNIELMATAARDYDRAHGLDCIIAPGARL